MYIICRWQVLRLLAKICIPFKIQSLSKLLDLLNIPHEKRNHALQIDSPTNTTTAQRPKAIHCALCVFLRRARVIHLLIAVGLI